MPKVPPKQPLVTLSSSVEDADAYDKQATLEQTVTLEQVHGVTSDGGGVHSKTVSGISKLAKWHRSTF